MTRVLGSTGAEHHSRTRTQPRIRRSRLTTRGTDVTNASDDDQPTAVAKDGDVTAGVADSPRTVAAEHYAEPPTTIVPDVRAAPSAELAWSSETPTDEIGGQGSTWQIYHP
jgi:hypothetical protein